MCSSDLGTVSLVLEGPPDALRQFLLQLSARYPDALTLRYRLELPDRGEDNDVAYGYRLLELAAVRRGFKISGGEYRYIRLGETVSCRYDEEIKRKLAEKLEYFRDSMERGDFPLAEQPEGEDGVDPCRFCKYSEICGKTSGEEGED